MLCGTMWPKHGPTRPLPRIFVHGARAGARFEGAGARVVHPAVAIVGPDHLRPIRLVHPGVHATRVRGRTGHLGDALRIRRPGGRAGVDGAGGAGARPGRVAVTAAEAEGPHGVSTGRRSGSRSAVPARPPPRAGDGLDRAPSTTT